MSAFFDFVTSFASSEDIIDLFFILSDMKDIVQSADELCEQSCLDSLCSMTTNDRGIVNEIPLGKQVW